MVPECEWNVVQSCHNATVIHNIFICYSSKDISKCHVLQIYLSSVRISVRQVVVQWISMRSMLLEIQWKRCSWWKLRHQDVNFYSLSSLFILPSSRAEGLSLILYLLLFFLLSFLPPFWPRHTNYFFSFIFAFVKQWKTQHEPDFTIFPSVPLFTTIHLE